MSVISSHPIGARLTPSTLAGEFMIPRIEQAEVSSLIWELNVPRWWPTVRREILDLLAQRAVNALALRAAVSWVRHLPPEMPRPYIGIGDDESVSVEWDQGGNQLHVRFEDYEAEVYFSGTNGDEFETSMDAGAEKIRAAMMAIARS